MPLSFRPLLETFVSPLCSNHVFSEALVNGRHWIERPSGSTIDEPRSIWFHIILKGTMPAVCPRHSSLSIIDFVSFKHDGFFLPQSLIIIVRLIRIPFDPISPPMPLIVHSANIILQPTTTRLVTITSQFYSPVAHLKIAIYYSHTHTSQSTSVILIIVASAPHMISITYYFHIISIWFVKTSGERWSNTKEPLTLVLCRCECECLIRLHHLNVCNRLFCFVCGRDWNGNVRLFVYPLIRAEVRER